jgi:hypothetical protein
MKSGILSYGINAAEYKLLTIHRYLHDAADDEYDLEEELPLALEILGIASQEPKNLKVLRNLG